MFLGRVLDMFGACPRRIFRRNSKSSCFSMFAAVTAMPLPLKTVRNRHLKLSGIAVAATKIEKLFFYPNFEKLDDKYSFFQGVGMHCALCASKTKIYQLQLSSCFMVHHLSVLYVSFRSFRFVSIS